MIGIDAVADVAFMEHVLFSFQRYSEMDPIHQAVAASIRMSISNRRITGGSKTALPEPAASWRDNASTLGALNPPHVVGIVSQSSIRLSPVGDLPGSHHPALDGALYS
jgi:hypothetical protein